MDDLKDEDEDKVIKQSITLNTIIAKVIEAIVSYIALYFFTPIWKRIMKWWNKDNETTE
jgi:uncharacterized membrane protein